MDLFVQAEAAEAAKRFEGAETLCRRALRAKPTYTKALALLARLHIVRGDAPEGVRLLEQATSIDRSNPKLRYDLAVAQHKNGQIDAAIACLQDLIREMPHVSPARAKLAYFLYENGRNEEAAGVYDDWLAFEPDNPEVAHMLQAAAGRDLSRCSTDFIVTHFDRLAPQFDKRLVSDLKYCGHEIASKALLAHSPVGMRGRTLDAGCGTGLCGPLLRPHASELVGVDLSTEMVKLAEAREVYDHLVVSEICDYLSRSAGAFDFIVSSDTLIYFGDLQPVVSAARSALGSHGIFVATFERIGASAGRDLTYRLGPHGRYGHSPQYLEAAFSREGFDVLSLDSEAIRVELGKPVEGLIIVARCA